MYEFIHEIESYREKTTRAVVLVQSPQDDSTDNALLFSSIYMVMLSLYGNVPIAEIKWYNEFIAKHRLKPGSFKRHLLETFPSSHDDHTGIAVASALHPDINLFALEIYLHGEDNLWIWNRNFLGRIIDFIPTIKTCAGVKLSMFEQLMFIVGTLGNLFEPKQETSGKILLWLKHKALWGKYRSIDTAITIWRWWMKKRYPNGMQDVMAIYYGAQHPFSRYASKEF